MLDNIDYVDSSKQVSQDSRVNANSIRLKDKTFNNVQKEWKNGLESDLKRLKKELSEIEYDESKSLESEQKALEKSKAIARLESLIRVSRGHSIPKNWVDRRAIKIKEEWLLNQRENCKDCSAIEEKTYGGEENLAKYMSNIKVGETEDFADNAYEMGKQDSDISSNFDMNAIPYQMPEEDNDENAEEVDINIDDMMSFIQQQLAENEKAVNENEKDVIINMDEMEDFVKNYENMSKENDADDDNKVVINIDDMMKFISEHSDSEANKSNDDEKSVVINFDEIVDFIKNHEKEAKSDSGLSSFEEQAVKERAEEEYAQWKEINKENDSEQLRDEIQVVPERVEAEEKEDIPEFSSTQSFDIEEDIPEFSSIVSSDINNAEEKEIVVENIDSDNIEAKGGLIIKEELKEKLQRIREKEEDISYKQVEKEKALEVQKEKLDDNAKLQSDYAEKMQMLSDQLDARNRELDSRSDSLDNEIQTINDVNSKLDNANEELYNNNVEIDQMLAELGESSFIDEAMDSIQKTI